MRFRVNNNGTMRSVRLRAKSDGQVQSVSRVKYKDGKWTDKFIPRIYGVRIDRSNPNSVERAIYTDDAVGMIPVNLNIHSIGSWPGNPLVADIKPVLRKSDGTWQDLDKNNLANGANLTTLGDDVLVQFRTWWLSITGDTRYIYIKFANKKIDGTYHKYASTYKGKDVGCFHVGAYHSTVSGNKAYSVAGRVPKSNLNGETFTRYAQARGEGFDELNWHQLTYMVCLSYLLCKGTYKMGLGSGYTNKFSAENNVQYPYDLGMLGSSGHNPSFLWMEAFWNNVMTCISGVYLDTGNIMIQMDGELSKYSGSGFQSFGTTKHGMSSCLKDVKGTDTASGLIPTEVVADSRYSTYFQCYSGTLERNLVYGGYTNDISSGTTCLRFNRAINQKSSNDGGRIVYRAGRPGVEPI